MKRSTLILGMCLVFTSTSYAQQNSADAPASKEDILRYFDAIHMHDLLQSMTTFQAKEVTQQINDSVSKRQDLPPDAEARFDKIIEDVFKSFSVDDYIPVMIPVYQKHFTKGDIETLISFYSSPAGHKALEGVFSSYEELAEARFVIQQQLADRIRLQIAEETTKMQKEATTPSNPR